MDVTPAGDLAAADEHDDVRRGARGTRAVVLGFLAALLLSRAADAAEHVAFWYMLFVVVLFILPTWFASGVARGLWTRMRWWLLGVQAVLTYIPFAVFGGGWVGGISGLLGGLVLLTVSAPASWVVFGALLALEEALWLVVGLPLEPPVHAALWVLIAFADTGLALFGLTWLAELVRQVDATRDELAVAAITRQRLAIAERLRSMIGERIQVVTVRAKASLRALSTNREDARVEIVAAGVTAREMLAEARAMASDRHDEIRPKRERESGVVLAPRVARAVLFAVLVLFALQNLLNVALTGESEHPVIAFEVALIVSIAIPALQLRHSGARHGGARPAGWKWTFGAQALLTYAQYPLVQGIGLIFIAFLAGSALLLFGSWQRWVWFCAIVASMPVLSLMGPGATPLTAVQIRWTVYATATFVAFGLLVYGLSRLAGLAVRLAALREELAELAAVRERLRLARDTHDLLGLSLSAVALKTDLVAALIGRDDSRAAHELDELLRLCLTAGNDARLVAEDNLRLSFVTELGLAYDILTSSGIAVRLPDQPAPTQAEVDKEVDVVLATVVREAVTNILRHSAARLCTIGLADDAGMLRLRICNDGVADDLPEGTDSGHGLTNLRVRVEAVEGRFSARRTAGEFELLAEFPYRVRS